MGYHVDPMNFAGGGFSDVRKRNPGGQVIAVKVSRMAEHSDVLEPQRVGYAELYLPFRNN